MLVVGYGEDSMTGLKYWLLQNSWGVQWGEKGFMRILRTDGPGPGVCGLATNPTMAMGGRLLLQSNKTHALAPQSELRSLFDSTNEWLQSHLGGFVLTLALALLACSVYILRRGRMAMLSSSPTIFSSSANERSSLLHSGEIQRDYEAL